MSLLTVHLLSSPQTSMVNGNLRIGLSAAYRGYLKTVCLIEISTQRGIGSLFIRKEEMRSECPILDLVRITVAICNGFFRRLRHLVPSFFFFFKLL